MQKMLVALTTAISIMVAVTAAQAMMTGTAPVIRTTFVEPGWLEHAKYVCHHRFYTSRRICWWRPEPFRKWRWRRWRHL
jgi:hypothetical protein